MQSGQYGQTSAAGLCWPWSRFPASSRLRTRGLVKSECISPSSRRRRDRTEAHVILRTRAGCPTLLVSILIVNWNTSELTLACLGSLANAASGDALRGDRRRQRLGGRIRRSALAQTGHRDCSATISTSDSPPPSIKPFRRSHGDYVLLLNSDVTLAPDALSVLARFLDEREALAGVGPLST